MSKGMHTHAKTSFISHSKSPFLVSRLAQINISLSLQGLYNLAIEMDRANEK